MLTQLFDNNNKLDRLENFISVNGAIHYKKNINKNKINLIKREQPLMFEKYLDINGNKIKIFKPPFEVFWEILDYNE